MFVALANEAIWACRFIRKIRLVLVTSNNENYAIFRYEWASCPYRLFLAPSSSCYDSNALYILSNGQHIANWVTPQSTERDEPAFHSSLRLFILWNKKKYPHTNQGLGIGGGWARTYL